MRKKRGRKQNRKRTINIDCIEYVKYRFLSFLKVKFIAPLVVYLVPKFPRTPRTILSPPLVSSPLPLLIFLFLLSALLNPDTNVDITS